MKHTWKTLYGSRAKPENIACWCSHHRCWLTPSQMIQHKCLAKNCSKMKKKRDHPMWETRDQNNIIKKQNKIARTLI